MNKFEWAEGLIRQLPEHHDGRNSWLLNYSTADDAKELRAKHPYNPRYIPLTRQAEKASAKPDEAKISIRNLCQVEQLSKLGMDIKLGRTFMGQDVYAAHVLFKSSGSIILEILHDHEPYVLVKDYFNKLKENDNRN